MTRTMRDSTNAADIPVHGSDLVAGYANGRYAWSAADFARFPHAGHVLIDVNGSAPAAGVLDVETGDATPAGAVIWAKQRHAAHPGAYPPVIYCNRATLTPLFDAMHAAGLHVMHDFRLWVATLDGTKTLPDMTGVTAVQWAGEAQTGGHYDESVVYDPAWHPTSAPPQPQPVPPPHPVPPPTTVTSRTYAGNTSLRDAAHNHGMTTQQVLWVTARQQAGGFDPLQGPYVSAGKWDANMPAGMILWFGPVP